jgi:hypothetical protein
MEFKFAVPDLSTLRAQAPRALFLRAFVRDPNPGWAVALGVNYLRSSDLAVVEYEICRELLHRIERGDDPAAARSGAGKALRAPDGTIVITGAVAATSFPVQFLRAVGHMEVCVTATARALRYVERLHGRPDAAELRVPKLSKIAPNDLAQRIRSVRNAIEHSYDDINEDRKNDVVGDYALDLNEDNLAIGEWRIGYDELAVCLRSLCELSRRLVPPAAAATDAGPKTVRPFRATPEIRFDLDDDSPAA